MTDAPDRDLEDRLDRAIRALPAPAAPPTLLPRVMAAVELEAALAAPVAPATQPSGTWWKWSWPARVASLAGAACLLALIVYGWSHLDPAAAIRLAGNGRAGG